MIRFIRELRLIPIALIASACLLALKAADFMLDGSYLGAENASISEDTSVVRTTPDVVQQSGSALSWARQMFNFPDGAGSSSTASIAPPPPENINADITGTVPSEAAAPDKKADGKPDAAAAPATTPAKDAKDAKPPPSGTVIQLQGPGQPSPSERAILERLQERRQELETRARELDIRESLITAAEKRMEGQLAEMKEVESRITVETQQKDDAEAARFKGLVTMYENMKPRDAAKIFDRLEIGILLKVSTQINPRKMSDILAQMSPDTAERLTVEMASKAEHVQKSNPTELPKIEGKPTTP